MNIKHEVETAVDNMGPLERERWANRRTSVDELNSAAWARKVSMRKGAKAEFRRRFRSEARQHLVYSIALRIVAEGSK